MTGSHAQSMISSLGTTVARSIPDDSMRAIMAGYRSAVTYRRLRSAQLRSCSVRRMRCSASAVNDNSRGIPT